MITNLVLDGNYLLYRAVFLLNKLKTLYGDLDTLLLNDYNNMTNGYPFNCIYFVSDSKKSWRKNIYPEYKQGRKKDIDIDWEFVFDTYDKFQQNIKQRHNCLVYKIDPFEGDDIIAHIVSESNKEGTSNYIVSNDGDIHQLLKFSVVDNYINVMYNHKFNDEKLYVPKNFELFIAHLESMETDIFDLNNDNDFVHFIEKVKQRSKIVQVNKEESYFKKLVAGDSGDNVMSVVKFTKDTRGIGSTGADVVWNMFKARYPGEIDFDSDDFINKLIEILSIYRKNKDDDFKTKVFERIKFSRRLTRLDGRYLPDGMYETLRNQVKI